MILQISSDFRETRQKRSLGALDYETGLGFDVPLSRDRPGPINYLYQETTAYISVSVHSIALKIGRPFVHAFLAKCAKFHSSGVNINAFLALLTF